jgi:long-chain acyl-CoA synthetase
MPARPWLRHYDPGVPPTIDSGATTLLDKLRQHAAERPDAAALLFKGRRLSWRQLDALSDACAAGLAARGVRKGDRVALILPTCPQWVIAQMAAWKIGAVVIALNPIYTEHELLGLLRNSGARIAIVITRASQKVRAVQAQTAVELVIATSIKEYLPRHLAIAFTLFKETQEGHRIRLAPGDVALQSLLRRHAGDRPTPVTLDGDDDAIVLASGGTTGTPKGVVGQHKCYTCAGAQIEIWTRSTFDAGRDVILLPLPLCHVYANVGGLGLGLFTGSPLALVPNPRDIADVLRTIERTRPAFMMSVPTLFQAMLASPDVQKGKIDFSSIKISFSGAAALMAATKEQFERLTRGTIIEGYSLTEGMMACLINPLKGRAKLGSIGVPLPSVEARIVDKETGRADLPSGQEGELILAAPQLMKGYWRNPDETADSLRRGPDGRLWLHTGDVGFMDEDGFVFLTDRKKDLIKTSGYQVWPREVEEVLTSHPAVAEAGVAGVPDTLKGESVKAWIVLRAGQVVSEDDLRRHCKALLAPFKVPAAFEFRPELPKSLVGKVLRRELVRQHVSAA